MLVLGLAGAWWSLADGREIEAWESNGIQASYYADGKVESEVCYRAGVLHGPAHEWYPDGKQAARGTYEDGERAGEWTFWRVDGSLDAERTGLYERGRRVGPAQDRADS